MIELLNIDCMEYMKTLPDKAFDLTITSPPYNMNLRVNSRGDGYCSRQIVKEISTKYKNYDDNLPMDEYKDFLVSVMKELVRVSEVTFFNIQVITGNKPAFFSAVGEMSSEIKELIVWDKGAGQPAIQEGVMNSCFELILVLGGNPITRSFQNRKFKRGTVDNIFRIGKSSATGIDHKASFPIDIPNKILHVFAKDGDRIFDPFLGTGTTAISAHNGGFDFVGCEIDIDYYNAAKERFKNATAQTSLI